MRGPCVSCKALPKCRKATPEMVLLLQGCGLYEEVPEPIVNARVRAIDLFGPDVVTKTKRKVDMEIVGQRKHLRALAVLLGAVKQGSSFSMQSPKLVEAILSVTDDDGNPRFPDIANMENDSLTALVAELKSGGKPTAPKKSETQPVEEEEEAEAAPAPKKPRKARKPRKPKVEEPVSEDAPEEEDSSPAPARKPGRKPGRGRSRKAAAPASAAPAAPSSSKEMGDLTDMVKTLGLAVMGKFEEFEKREEAATANLQEIQEHLILIDQHLCWLYNQEQDPGNEIEQLKDISWV